MRNKISGEKFEQSAGDDSLNIGNSNPPEETPPVRPSAEILLTFKENRFYELHIGRNIIPFSGRETKKASEAILHHKDWTPAIAEKFLVQEIK